MNRTARLLLTIGFGITTAGVSLYSWRLGILVVGLLVVGAGVLNIEVEK